MRLTVKLAETGLTLEEFLKKRGFSSNLIRTYKRHGEMLVNNIKSNTLKIVKSGDVVDLILYDEKSDIEPEEMDLNICYEDEDILVLDKPPGIVVHPTTSHHNGTLANGVARYFEKIGLNSFIRPVNRLDKDTSGLVIFAKRPFMQYYMQIVKPMSKMYIAVVEGQMTGEGRIDLPIARKPDSIIERMVADFGDRAVTNYKVIKSGKVASILRINIETGRTHQIRVHLSHIGHPILGDTLYGSNDKYIKRQALHAYRVSFMHPILEKYISVYSPLPEDIKKLYLLF